MNKTIYVIGTRHSYQHLDKSITTNGHLAFKNLIKRFITKYNISIVAEESNQEALQENKISESALQMIAQDTDTNHLFTEANRAYRSQNEMDQENNIRISCMMDGSDEKEIEKKIQESYRAREIYWLNLISKKNIWPVLFVCGSDHSAEFSKLALNSGFECELLHSDWRHL